MSFPHLNKKTTILFITAYYPPHHGGGFGLRCRDVAEGLRRRGHSLTILTNRCALRGCCEHQSEERTLRLLALRPAGDNPLRQILFDRRELLQVERVIRQVQPRVIYLWHMQNLSNAILPFLAGQPTPLILDDGGSELIYLSRLQKRGLYFYKNAGEPRLKTWLKRLVKTGARLVSGGRIVPDWQWPEGMRVLFNSPSALEHARAQGGFVRNALVIPSGLDIARFPFKAAPRIHTPLKIILPARIKEQKGCLDGILLVDELRRRSVPAQLLIIGEAQSAAYLALLRREVEARHLSGQVDIRPMAGQDEMSRLYREHDFCFFPSSFKTGFSRVPLEAMASGCLVLTYGNEGSREVVQDGATGYLLPEGDVAAAAERVHASTLDHAGYLRILSAARRQVEESNSLEDYLQKVEELLTRAGETPS